MPLIELEILPGVLTERTERGAKGRWSDGNRIRFRQGLPEKLGGWQASTIAGDPIQGVPRSALDWQAIDQAKLTAVGTNLRLYQIYGGTAQNITPYRLATDAFGGLDTELTDPFDTTDTLSIVNVSHTGHGLIVGTAVYFDGATAVGGLTIDGEYVVESVIDADNYTIDAGSAATSTANGGGTVDYAYEINVGASVGVLGLGWGAGAWGEGTWGTAREVSSILLDARTWALDTWGEDLIANPRDGGIYVWDKSAGYADNRAAPITDAPAPALFTLVSPIDRHLIALGCVPIGGSTLDPLVIRWCSQNDYTDWTPTRLNTAGQRRLDGASTIMSGIRVREETLIFTDVSVFGMNFVGPPSIFSIRQLGGECGLIAPLARAEFGGIAFWMSYENFFYYDGSLNVLPCPVRNHVFDDVNVTARSQFHCGVNTLFHEIWFFYASAGSAEIDRYVIFGMQEQAWWYGDLDRTVWLDHSGVRLVPAAFDASGTMYDHETGTSADGSAMSEFLESWDFEVPGEFGSTGQNLVFMDALIPDFLRMTGPMQVTLNARKYPAGEQVTRGPFDVRTFDEYIRPRIRGRQVSLRMESNQAFPSTDWRAGVWRMNVRPHGKR